MIAAIVRRELLHLGRQGRLFFWRLVYLLLILTFVALGWLDDFESFGTESLDAVRETLRDIFWGILFAHALLLSIYIPLTAGTAFTEERTTRSLELLQTAGVSSLRLVAGKTASFTLMFLLFVVATLPVIVGVAVLGQMTPAVSAAAVAALVLWIALVSALGVLASVLFRKPYMAVLVTTLAVGLLLILWTLLWGGPLGYLWQPAAGGSSPDILQLLAVWISAHLALLLIVFASTVAVMRWSRPHRRIPRKARPIPMRRRSNPIVWRARLASRFTRRKRLIYIALVALIALASKADYDFNVYVVALEVFLLFITTTVVAACAVAEERETGAFDLLLATPLTARKILAAKLQGAVATILPLALIPVAHTLIISCSWSPNVRGAVARQSLDLFDQRFYFSPILWMVPLGLIACTLRLLVVGLAVSANAPNTRKAVRWALGLWFLADLVLIGLGMLFALIAELTESLLALAVVMILVPLTMAVVALRRRTRLLQLLALGLAVLFAVTFLAAWGASDVERLYEGLARLALLHWLAALAVHWPVVGSWSDARYFLSLTAVAYGLSSLAMWGLLYLRANAFLQKPDTPPDANA